MKLILTNEENGSQVAIKLDTDHILDNVELAGHTFQNMIKLIIKEKQNEV